MKVAGDRHYSADDAFHLTQRCRPTAFIAPHDTSGFKSAAVCAQTPPGLALAPGLSRHRCGRGVRDVVPE